MARNGMKTGRDYKNVERFHLLDYDTFVFQLCHTFHLRSTLLSPTKPKKKKKPSITPVSLPYLAITDWVLSLPRSDSNRCPDFL